MTKPEEPEKLQQAIEPEKQHDNAGQIEDENIDADFYTSFPRFIVILGRIAMYVLLAITSLLQTMNIFFLCIAYHYSITHPYCRHDSSHDDSDFLLLFIVTSIIISVFGTYLSLCFMKMKFTIKLLIIETIIGLATIITYIIFQTSGVFTCYEFEGKGTPHNELIQARQNQEASEKFNGYVFTEPRTK